MSAHTAEELFMYAGTHKSPHTSFIHTSNTPTSTPGQEYSTLLMLGRQELMEERLGRKLKAKKKVESPAHDSSPITSVNPGAQE